MVSSEVVSVARKWGNSIGISLPSDIVSKEKIKPNDKVIISVKKAVSISDLFGTLKFKKPTQKIKDEMRAGWGE